MNAQQALEDLLRRSHDDPEFFFLHVLRVPEWTDTHGNTRRIRKWQHDLLAEIRDALHRGERHLRITVRSCHGAGKGWLLAGLVVFIVATRPDSRVLTTAPSWSGVENLLWPEINKHYRGSLLAAVGWGSPLTTEFKVRDTWYATGATSDRPEKLEGHHSMVCAMRAVDEAKAVPDEIYVATDGMLDAPETWDVWISTPSIRLGKYYEREARGDEGVIRAVVTVEDLIADGVPGRAEYKANCIKDYGGAASDEYKSRCLAQYIDQAEGALYPYSWIERAMENDWPAHGSPLLGFDVAGSVDGDESATALAWPEDALHRRVAEVVETWKQADTMVSKGNALKIARERHAAKVRVDVVGIGKGVADALAADFPVEEYRAAAKAWDDTRFINRKAEDCWNVRALLEKNLLRIKPSAKLKAQMLAMKYEINAQGKLKVIDPPDSPDHHDALVIALAGRPKVDHGGFLDLIGSDLATQAVA